jgi:hypothetical protein
MSAGSVASQMNLTQRSCRRRSSEASAGKWSPIDPTCADSCHTVAVKKVTLVRAGRSVPTGDHVGFPREHELVVLELILLIVADEPESSTMGPPLQRPTACISGTPGPIKFASTGPSAVPLSKRNLRSETSSGSGEIRKGFQAETLPPISFPRTQCDNTLSVPSRSVHSLRVRCPAVLPTSTSSPGWLSRGAVRAVRASVPNRSSLALVVSIAVLEGRSNKLTGRGVSARIN